MSSTHLNVYVDPPQASAWTEEADGLDMGKSEYIRAMVEAGRKKFDFDGYLDPDPSVDVTEAQLREQRDRARTEADALRARVRALEDELTGTDRATTFEFISERPGATFESILGHIRATAPERLTGHLERMEGREIRVSRDDEGERFYPLTESAVADRDADANAEVR